MHWNLAIQSGGLLRHWLCTIFGDRSSSSIYCSSTSCICPACTSCRSTNANYAICGSLVSISCISTNANYAVCGSPISICCRSTTSTCTAHTCFNYTSDTFPCRFLTGDPTHLSYTPHPKAGQRNISKGKRKRKTAILTDTPEKEALELEKMHQTARRNLNENKIKSTGGKKDKKPIMTLTLTKKRTSALFVWRVNRDQERFGYSAGNARHGLTRPALMGEPIILATTASLMWTNLFLSKPLSVIHYLTHTHTHTHTQTQTQTHAHTHTHTHTQFSSGVHRSSSVNLLSRFVYKIFCCSNFL